MVSVITSQRTLDYAGIVPKCTVILMHIHSTRTHARMHTHTDRQTDTCMHACTHTHTHTHTPSVDVQIITNKARPQ